MPIIMVLLVLPNVLPIMSESPKGRVDLSGKPFVDVRVTVNSVNIDNETYVYVSLILYNLINESISLYVVDYPSIKVSFNDQVILDQLIIVDNESLVLGSYEVKVLFNTSFLMNRNVSLEIYPGMYLVATTDYWKGNTTEKYIVKGNTVYIEYRDRIIISTESVVLLQSVGIPSTMKLFGEPSNDTCVTQGHNDIVHVEGTSNTSISNQYGSVNETFMVDNAGIPMGNITSESNTSKTMQKPMDTAEAESKEHNGNTGGDQLSIGYEFLTAFTIAIIVLAIAKLIVYVLNRKT